ncbi:MAG: ABC transporter substrate-binding protein [Chloroflexi bacterium]|nr:ABC transporter substrate-binding protein [Chloroflexota bacterium]
MKFWWKLILLFTTVLGLIACGAGAAPTPSQEEEAATPAQAEAVTPVQTEAAQSAPATAAPAQTSAEVRQVRLGVGYIPDVQFAPFYVAQSKGYYAEEGLEVAIEYGFENDFVALAAQGEREFAVASGDQVILARAQGLPITYVMKWYQRYPVALVAPAAKGIAEPGDLVGKKVGLPGFFGATFIGWKALVYAAQIDEGQVNVEEIGFTQTAAVQQGLVDAAMVYIANEPNQLRSQGIEVNVIEVSKYIDLVSNGLVVGDKLIADDPDLVQRMVRATLRGLKDTIDHPDDAFAIVRQVIPEITDDQAPTQRKVLEDSIKLWQGDKLGQSDPQAWQASVEFMSKTGLLEKTLEPETLYTNKFVEVQ